MKNRRQWLIWTAIVLMVGLAIYHTSETRNESLPRVGFKAPSFALPSLDQQSYSLDMLDGKPVVINFWASWCGPCKIEAPELERLYLKYHGQLEIYAINITSGDTVEDARSFAEHYQFTFPVLLDEKGEVAKKYQIRPVPTTFFVNREGTIVDQVIGVIDPQTIESKFKQLIKDP